MAHIVLMWTSVMWPGVGFMSVTALSTQLQVTDRPVTQQGLGGPKTAGVRGGWVIFIIVVVVAVVIVVVVIVIITVVVCCRCCQCCSRSCHCHRLLPLASTRGHQYKLYKKHCPSRIRSSFFSERIVTVWNSLPESVDFSSLVSFIHTVTVVDLSDHLRCF